MGGVFCGGVLGCAAGCCGALGVLGVLPAGCWGGLAGVEPVPVPGWLWVPAVPGEPWVVGLLAGPGWFEELGVPLLGVAELGVPLLGVEVRSDPVPVEVEGVVVGVLVDEDAVLGGVDRAGCWFGVVVLGFWPGVWVRVPPVWSAVLRGAVRSPGVVFPGVLRGAVPSPGVVLRGGVRSPGVVPGVFRGVVPSPGVVLPGVRWVGIRPSGVPGVRPSAVPGTRPSDVGVGVLRGVVVGDVGLGVEAGPVPVGEGVPGVLAEGVLAAPELGLGLVGLVPDGMLPDVLPPW
jgi:hypothetical protein